jgi:hemerythrin-like domain-containing protein
MLFNENSENSRRDFLAKSFKIATVTGIIGIGLISSCEKEEKEEGEKEVSPPEDLMQEHGLLNRILLIYDSCKMDLSNKKFLQKEALLNSAVIIRNFVQDYHEKQEENYLFPRFEKANQLTGLVKTLRQQHKVGRTITDEIMQLCKNKELTNIENNRLIQLLTYFNTMYRPHEAREDTVLFPAFRKIVSKHEYDSLGEEFEKNEHKLFGEDGFDVMVDKITNIEKQMGIYELAQFTPNI